MARGWRVLDATQFEGVVSGTRGQLLLTAPGQPSHEVPAAEVAVLLVGRRTDLTAAALHRLSQYDITLLLVDWRGIPYTGLIPWSSHGRVAARHRAQAALSLPRRKNAWMRLVRAKVVGQAAALAQGNEAASKHLLTLAAQVRSGDPGNVEAIAARYYWPHLFSRHFSRDQDSYDALNSMLNYGYMVLRGFGVRAVVSAGLSPPLGLFHRGRGNYFNLVDDLIEPFRPVIDNTVWHLRAAASLDEPEVKLALVNAATGPFTSDGTRVPGALEDLAQRLGRYVEGESETLAVGAWNGYRADQPVEEPPW